MHITISTGSIDLGEAFYKTIEAELQDRAAKYFNPAVECIVHFTKQRVKQGAKNGELIHTNIIIDEGSTKTLKASAEDINVENSFRLALEKITNQLRKLNEKQSKHNRKDAVKFKEKLRSPEFIPEENIIDEYLYDHPEDLKEETKEHLKTLSEETKDLQKLTYEEAIKKLNSSQEPALIFENKANGNITVAQRRKDGNVSFVDTGKK